MAGPLGDAAGGSGALLTDEPLEPELHESRLAYEGRVWDVREERFAYGGGELTRHYVDHPGAVAVLALDEADRVLLIQQYRHPVRRREWELPAGLLDAPDESPLAAARRELAEEVDLAAEEWALLADFVTSPGGSNEAVRIYLARGLRSTGRAFERSGEEADIVPRWVPLEEAVEAVRASRLGNAIAVVGVLSAEVERARDWRGLRDAETPWTRSSR